MVHEPRWEESPGHAFGQRHTVRKRLHVGRLPRAQDHSHSSCAPSSVATSGGGFPRAPWVARDEVPRARPVSFQTSQGFRRGARFHVPERTHVGLSPPPSCFHAIDGFELAVPRKMHHVARRVVGEADPATAPRGRRNTRWCRTAPFRLPGQTGSGAPTNDKRCRFPPPAEKGTGTPFMSFQGSLPWPGPGGGFRRLARP